MRLPRTVIAILFAVTLPLQVWGDKTSPATGTTDEAASLIERADSVADGDLLQGDAIMAVSDTQEGPPSFMDGILPLPPQAAALARYAEYPVSHTTGIPDISIPVYAIDLGGFTLPVSLSYHASGARPDEVPTCVGLGWALNAGGMISRTILGAPDFYKKDEASTDYTLRDYAQLQTRIKNEGTYRALATGNPEYDTESDRYCLNAGGHSLVFRYSHEDGRFIVLNHEPCRISVSGHGEETAFKVEFPDGTDWTFSETECSGIDRDGEGHPYVSAWYVTKISTRWGDIDFTYRHGRNLTLVRESSFYTAGTFIEPDEEGRPEEVDRIYRTDTRSNLVLGQTLVESISWNGHQMLFSYSSPWPGDVTDRLETVRVISSDDTELKRVSLGNDFYWASLNAHLYPSDHGRRLLKSVTDSQHGIYRMEYDTHLALPMLGQQCVEGYSDFYGFYRKGPNWYVNEKMRSWLRGIFDGKPYRPDVSAGPDRTPDPDAMKTGMLTKITFPTGGDVSFEYEANGPRAGGLHLSAMTLKEGNVARRYSYSYSGMLQPQEDPQDLMCFAATMVVVNKSIPYSTYEHRKAVISPLFSTYLSTSSVVFTEVVETLPDGSSVRYEYEKDELAYRYGYEDGLHPSLFWGSVIDWGNRLPLLKCRTMTDAGGKAVSEENIVYERNDKRDEFPTGVRVSMEYTCFNWLTKEYDCWGPSPFSGGTVQMRKTTAKVRSATVKSRTVTDFTTGVSSTESYTYDPSLRTTLPKTVTVTDDAGTTLTTEYTYPFDRSTDDVCREMTELGVTDAVVAVRVSSGGRVVSSSETGYTWSGGFFHPAVSRSWTYPTSAVPQSPPSMLPERERVTSYNAKGRPLSIKLNDTDLHSYSWDTTGTLLLTSTAPGSLTTTYTHKPLFGIESVTLPNGYKTNYIYNEAGMPASVADTAGAIETYSYSIANHPTASMTGAGNSVTTSRFLNVSGPKTVTTRQYLDGLGRPSSVVEGGRNTGGKYLYTAVSYDSLGRQSQTVLPSVGDTDLKSMTFGQVKDLSPSAYGNDQFAWSETTYDALDRPIRVTTPGNEWHSADKGKVTEYIANAASSVRKYSAPMTSTSLSTGLYYPAKTLQGVRSADEDGKEMTVYTDKLGRKVLERRGPESKKGQNDTYFVYNALGQLRFVLSPSYQESANLTEYAYEYRYDQHGNVVYKAIPGAGYTEYWYDRAGRLAYMQDANLRASSLYRFFLYDKAGRQVIQGVCKTCTLDETVNFANYTGGTSGFMSTGYTLGNSSRIQQATLETVAFFDAYTFRNSLDSHLNVTGTASAKGLQTGAVVYASDGSKSVSAIYYDAKGRIIETRELTHFGTKRTTTTSYNYAGQPLKTTLTEGTVSLITENTYDASSGLLTATDVTVNGTKQCVSKVTYDDLGRIKSVKRGNDTNSGGTVNYTYNIHGQIKSITGPGFVQNLYYADGNGTKLYNGSVSSMTWIMKGDATVRGYKYSYNDYGWLTAAIYGETSGITANKDRYSEKISGFTRNGGITGLQRYGKQSSLYGKVDDLTITYSGNRISTVKDAAPAVTQNGSMDYPGGSTPRSFGYNAFGALVKDEARGISSVSYDNFGNPKLTVFASGGTSANVYSATGEKLKMTTRSSATMQADAALSFVQDLDVLAEDTADDVTGVTVQSTTEYHGPIIYRDGAVDMVLFPGGYATISGTTVTFHYYTQDYLGNNRAVINGSTGAVEQMVSYYPYGAVIPDLTTPASVQPYKFGGKELLSANGLNEYDFGARNYYPAVPGFTKPDQMCEKYYWLSPYLFCANNPVNLIDPDGKEWRPIINSTGDYVDFSWIESKDARDENGKLLPYHYEQAILFSAEGEDGKTFDKDNPFNIGTSIATVYKADGTTEDFDACTYPSDVEKYATVPEGYYEAKVGKHKNDYVALRLSDIDTENFNANSIELGKPNPAHPNSTKATGINIHRPGLYNKTGITNDKRPISEGCLLIDRSKWNSFISIFDNPTQKNNVIGVIVQR